MLPRFLVCSGSDFLKEIKGFFFLPQEKVQKSSRFYFMDGFRCFALLIMISTHSIKTFIDPSQEGRWSDLYKAIFTKVPGPIFLFMVGAAYILSRNARIRKGWDKSRLLAYYSRRSLILLVLAYIYKLIDIPLFKVSPAHVLWWIIDILNIIAVSLFLVALTDCLLHDHRHRKKIFFLISMGCVVISPIMLNLRFPEWIPNSIAWYLNGKAPNAFFTLFPFLGYPFFGALVAEKISEGGKSVPRFDFERLVYTLLVIFFFSKTMEFLLPNFQKYFFVTAYYAIGYVLLLAGVWLSYQFQRIVGFGPLLIIGSHTMVGYWVHAKMIFLYYSPLRLSQSCSGACWLLFKVYCFTLGVVLIYAYFKRKWLARRLQNRSTAVF